MRLVRWIAGVGSTAATSIDGRRRLAVVNISAVLFALVPLAWLPLGVWTGNPMLIASATVGLVQLGALGLHAAGRHRAAPHWLQGTATLTIAAQVIVWGAPLQGQYLFLVLALLPPLTLPREHTLSAVAWSVLALVGFGATVWAAPPSVPGVPYALDPELVGRINAVLIGTSLLPLFLFVRRAILDADARAERQYARAQRLLHNILPPPIAARLQAGEAPIADATDEVSVVFVDIVGFTPLAATLEPSELVTLLDEVFHTLDALGERHGIEKIKTIGDAWMAAAGVPEPVDDPTGRVAAFALDVLDAVDGLRSERGLDVRIGLHTGPVVAGVIGRSKLAWDVWGDAVNLASRMESHGAPGRAHASGAAAERLAGDPRFRAERRGPIEVKGRGMVETAWIGRAPVSATSPTGSSAADA